MFVFVCMTNILLITSLISLLSNSLTKVRSLGIAGFTKRPDEADPACACRSSSIHVKSISRCKSVEAVQDGFDDADTGA
jgi:hypothetical protein